jgi:hypothetical protein
LVCGDVGEVMLVRSDGLSADRVDPATLARKEGTRRLDGKSVAGITTDAIWATSIAADGQQSVEACSTSGCVARLHVPSDANQTITNVVALDGAAMIELTSFQFPDHGRGEVGEARPEASSQTEIVLVPAG